PVFYSRAAGPRQSLGASLIRSAGADCSFLNGSACRADRVLTRTRISVDKVSVDFDRASDGASALVLRGDVVEAQDRRLAVEQPVRPRAPWRRRVSLPPARKTGSWRPNNPSETLSTGCGISRSLSGLPS